MPAQASEPAETIECAAAPTAPSPEAETFYAYALRELAILPQPFLVAGTYAFAAYTGISRKTKDLDVFCRPDDWPAILAHFKGRGCTVEVEDARWLGKVFCGAESFDLIFASRNGSCSVDTDWFAHARQVDMLGSRVSLIAPTELILSKAFIQVRHRYDGADIVHLILRQADAIDWSRLLAAMEPHWEILFGHLVNFRWVYPGERDKVPRWLMDALMERLAAQLAGPPADGKICRGRMMSHVDYETAHSEWGYTEKRG